MFFNKRTENVTLVQKTKNSQSYEVWSDRLLSDFKNIFTA
jgi:hypothetical protein